MSPGPLLWREVAVDRVEPRTPRISSVFLAAELPGYRAGQHIDVRLTANDGYQAERSYSVVSAPGAAEIELAIEALEDGEVSPWFHDVAQAGDRFEIRGPIGGHFVWTPQDKGAVLLLGGGSGVAPLVSIVRDRAAARSATPALLVFSARTWEDLAFRDELLALGAADPALTVVLVTSREPARRPGDLGRRLDQQALREILARWGQAPATTYVCGSNRFVDTVADALVAEGVAAEAIRTERYGDAAA